MQPKQEENVLPWYIRKEKRLKNNEVSINFNKLEYQNKPKDNKRKYLN